MSTTILAIGAAGKFAGLVIPALAQRGAQVRGLVRQQKEAAEVIRHGAVEVAVGDLSDRPSVEAAMRGVQSVFYIAPASLANEATVGRSVVEAAILAGVRRFVFSSVIHPVLGLSNHAAKAPVEAAVLESALEYTFLHPAMFCQNFAAGWSRVVETGVIAEPWSIDTRFSRVDYRDVAEAAAIALTEDRLLDGTFELCADGVHDRRDVAVLMGKALGRQVKADRLDPDSLGPEATSLRPMFDHYDRWDLRGNALTLRSILGREPRSLQDYFEELAAGGGQTS